MPKLQDTPAADLVQDVAATDTAAQPAEATENDTKAAAMGLDLSAVATLSAADLAKLLTAARAAEKARKTELESLPVFAFVVVMTDSSLVYWSGKAADCAAAQAAAIAYAERDGASVFKDEAGNVGIAPRPIPAPRGRKAKADSAA